MPDTMVDAEVLKDAVHLACRAPSLHNSQPWQWVADSAGLQLCVDRSRILYSTDNKSGREALISCGAVLDHLRVAMAAAGWTANVDRFANPNNLDHLASIDLSPVSLVTDGHRRRADAILRRRTDRLPFRRPGEPGVVGTCAAQRLRCRGRPPRRDSPRAAPATGRGVTNLPNRCDCTILRIRLNYTGGQVISRILMGFRAVHWCRQPKVIESTSVVHFLSRITASGAPALEKTTPKCWFCPPMRTPATTR